MPEPEPAGGPHGAGQVPRPVQRLVPAADPGQRLAAGGDAVEQHPDRPDQLEALPPLAPLVEQREAEDQGQDRGQGRQEDVESHRSDRRALAGLDEPEQQAIEQGRGVAVQVGEPAPGRATGAGRARPARPGTAGGRRRRIDTASVRLAPPATRRARLVVDDGLRVGLEALAGRAVRRSGLEESDERGRPAAARPGGTPRARSSRCGIGRRGAIASGAGVVPPVDAGQPLRRWPRGSSAIGAPGLAAGRPGARAPPVEPAVAARRRPRADPAVIGPAPERVGIDAEQPAGRPERHPAATAAVGAGADRGKSGLSDARQDRAPTGRPGRGGRRPAARRHGNLGKSGCQIPPGRAEDRSAPEGVSNAPRRGDGQAGTNS